MNKSNTIGVDLAKNVIQVSVVSGRNKELLNKELTRKKFAEFLDDNARELPAIYRPTLACLFHRFKALLEDIKLLDQQIDASVKINQACHELTALEGVNPISALLLFATLGTGEAFKNGRESSAYIGLTPKQYIYFAAIQDK